MYLEEDVIEGAIALATKFIYTYTPFDKPFVRAYLRNRYLNFLSDGDESLKALYDAFFIDGKIVRPSEVLVSKHLQNIDYDKKLISEVFGGVGEQVEDPLKLVFLVATTAAFYHKIIPEEEGLESFLERLKKSE